MEINKIRKVIRNGTSKKISTQGNARNRKEGVREENGKRTRGEKDIKCIKQKGARIKIRT